ncbi:hypothetical protein MBCUR_09720 [Methanobrevibacter curvatus]|uniref:Uncharacterized protein n=1 Tax=Methanobrevibacter curvatus TaxID=49547 RepID=A0A166AYU1_9EURY|nr:hypothetical protein MBCUR_09720 [Methanobrevibacter curvatus]
MNIYKLDIMNVLDIINLLNILNYDLFKLLNKIIYLKIENKLKLEIIFEKIRN